MNRCNLERGRILALGLLCACAQRQMTDAATATPTSQSSQPSAAGSAAYAGVSRPTGQLPERVLGVTLDEAYPLDSIVEALSNLAQKPTSRVVFDVRIEATAYIQVLQEVAPVSFVMGEPVDSVSVERLSVDDYTQRTSECLDALSDYVDIWEIGNEVNGEWLGPSDEVQAKIVSAYGLVRERGLRTALTLYFNQGCVQKSDHELFTWAASNIPADMRQGLDYVWVSYYEQRCHQAEPDWTSVFERLHELFPHSRLGFGGVGTSDPTQKAELVKHFYSLDVPVPGFVGGYFWWYFREDMLPSSAPLWNVLNGSWSSPQP